MNPTEAKIAVMQAYLAGETIESRPHGADDWIETSFPLWSWSGCDYRVKPATRKKIKLLCYFTGAHLVWFTENRTTATNWTRVPAEDKEIEV